MSETGRRGVWIERSNIRLRDRDLRLSTHQWPATPLSLISAWLGRVLAGEVIAAAGKPMCGKGLLLQGNAGVGKTTIACAVLNEVLAKAPWTGDGIFVEPGMHTRRPVYYARYEALLGVIKAMYDARPEEEEDLRRICRGLTGLGQAYKDWTINLLTVDDLGKEYGSTFSQSTFENLIRTRYDRGLPTIITTNVPLADWGRTFNPEVASFAHEAFISVEMMGDLDRRLRR